MGKTEGKLSEKFMRMLSRSEAYKLGGEHEKALKIAESVLLHDPTCVEALEEAADNLLSLERPDAAKKTAEFCLTLDKDSYIANFVVGFLASRGEQWKLAVKHLRIANVGQPNNPEILRCLGWAMFHCRDLEGGIVCLRRAMALRSDDPAILCDLAACLLQLSRYKESLKLLEQATAVQPEDDRVKELLRVAKRLIRG